MVCIGMRSTLKKSVSIKERGAGQKILFGRKRREYEEIVNTKSFPRGPGWPWF